VKLTTPPALESTTKSLESVTNSAINSRRNLSPAAKRSKTSPASATSSDQLKDLSKDPGLKSSNKRRSPGGFGFPEGRRLAEADGVASETTRNQSGNPEAMDKLQKDLEKLQEAAKAMSDKNSAGGTDAEKQKMVNRSPRWLNSATDGPESAAADEAIAALALNQSDRFVKNLDAATKDLRSCATWQTASADAGTS